MSMFKKIAIISKIEDDSVKDSLNTVIKYLDSKNIQYFLDKSSSALLQGKVETSIDEIKNNSNRDISDITEMLESFLPFAKDRLQYDRDPEIAFESDPENAKNTLGKTAQYEPASGTITVFVDSRHPKDILRSFSHELVHHTQNCDGQFDNMGAMGEGYAQTDDHLRKMEEDAYLRGNMTFRDWEDNYKQTNRAFGNSLNERHERLYYELKRRLW